MLTLMNWETVPGRFRRPREETGALGVLGMRCLTMTLRVPERAGERVIRRGLERAAAALQGLRS